MPVLLASVLVAGCSSSDDKEAEPGVTRPAIRTGGCGTAEYALLPFDGMGRIVDWQYMTALSVSATFIDSALESEGITGFSHVQYGIKAYRIRYVTQDKGKEVETTALISYPDVADTRSFPTVLWTHGTSGFTDRCAPSANGLEGGLGNILLSSQGLVVVAPDYLGMNGMGAPAGFVHPYLQAEATAIASLDSLRALERFESGEGDEDLVARHDRKLVLWGASEGGFAALWSDRYWKAYGPDLDLVATVAVVPPSDLLTLTRKAVEQVRPTTAALVAAMVTLNQWHGNLAPLTEVITDDPPYNLASTVPQVLASGCDDGDAFDGITDVNQIYQQGFIDAVLAGSWDAVEPFGCCLRLGTLNQTDIPRGHDTPVFYVISGADELVVTDTQRQDFPVLCDLGYRTEYYECAGASHVDGAANSLPAQLQWVNKRLAGEPLGDTVCQVQPAVECASVAGGDQALPAPDQRPPTSTTGHLWLPWAVRLRLPVRLLLPTVRQRVATRPAARLQQVGHSQCSTFGEVVSSMQMSNGDWHTLSPMHAHDVSPVHAGGTSTQWAVWVQASSETQA